MTPNLSWNDRFALIDHFMPSDAQTCAVFGLTQDELDTARDLRAAGTFTGSPNFDYAPYVDAFAAAYVPPSGSVPTIANSGKPPALAVTKADMDGKLVPTAIKSTATVHARPETATKRVKTPQKRGRKGDKITKALLAVPTTPVPVDQFGKTHGVSLAVLRQSKRFMEGMDAATASLIGKVNVRQDKNTKRLMIWRDVVQP